LKLRRSKKGQIAVEFILMFVLVVSIIIYAFYFAVSFASLHYRTYEVFMINRAILASSPTDTQKGTRAKEVLEMYEASPSVTQISATSGLVCDFGSGIGGYRGIMDYGFPIKFNVSSNAGVACSVYANYVLPTLITGSGGNPFQVAIESLIGSEMTEDHCNCALDPTLTWSDCLGGSSTTHIQTFIDNGC